MTFWNIIVIVVLVMVFTNMRRTRDLNHRLRDMPREPQTFLDTGLNPSREAEMQREIEDLRERVKVLERIATDGRHSRAIAEEIERLRDS